MTLDEFFTGSKLELKPRTSHRVRKHKFRKETLPTIRRILLMLGQGKYPAQIARSLGKSKGTISYHLKNLIKHNFIIKEERFLKEKKYIYPKTSKGLVTFYNITKAGSTFLAGIEVGVFERVVRLHNLYVKYPIIVSPKIEVNWRKVQMTNWTQLLGSEMGLRIRKNPRSIEIIAKVVSGKDPYELYYQARHECDLVATHLQSKFGMSLGVGEISRKPHFGVYDPVAGKVTERFELSDDVAKMDRSEGRGEIDWYSPDKAKDYLLMPGRLAQVMRELDEIKDEVGETKAGMVLFSKAMEQHVALIAEVRDLVNELRDVKKGK